MLEAGLPKENLINNFRQKSISNCILVVIIAPVILDFLFPSTSIARLARIIIALAIICFLLLSSTKFLVGKISGLSSLILVTLLYLIGTLSSLIHGGVATPNFILLFLVLIISIFNSDLHSKIIDAIGFSTHILTGMSLLVIILKFNNKNLFFSSQGYSVFPNWLGLPGRNFGLFSHPNVLGAVSVVSSAFIICMKKRWIYKTYIFIPIVCILKSGSRTSIIGLSFCILYSLLINLISKSKDSVQTKSRYSLINGLFLLLIFIIIFFYFITYIRFLNPEALTGRVSIWKASLEITKNNSAIGLGWGWQGRAIQAQLLAFWESSAHNQLLEILFSAGILGLVIFLVLVTRGFLLLNKMPKINRILFATFLLSGISESYIDLQYPDIQTYLFFLIVSSGNLEINDDKF